MTKEAAVRIFSSLLILLFAYAAFSKLADHAVFTAQLMKFPWIGLSAGFISRLVPVIELITVLLLFFPSTVLYGLYASVVLLILFTTFLICMLSFVPGLPCSCGGIIATLSWKQHIFFNLFFIALAIAGICLKRKPGKQPYKTTA